MSVLNLKAAVIDIWLVFANRIDYPGKTVAQRFEYWGGELSATNETIVGDSHMATTTRIPPGKHRIDYHQLSPPLQNFDGLVEAWL